MECFDYIEQIEVGDYVNKFGFGLGFGIGIGCVTWVQHHIEVTGHDKYWIVYGL